MSVVELVSPLTPDECVERLRAATDREGLFSWAGVLPAIGSVSRRGEVRLRRRVGYRNSFQTILVGRLDAEGAGTVFRGQGRLHALVILFLMAWFGLVLLIGGGITVTSVGKLLDGERTPGAIASRLLLAAAPLVMLALGAGGVWFGRWAARDEERFLVAFVAQVIKAGPDPEV